jgi:hypothetical protein
MKINELSLSGLAGAVRARSKDPKIAAKGKAQLAKAAAKDAGKPGVDRKIGGVRVWATGQAAKKKKMAKAMLAKWQDKANDIRVKTGSEPNIEKDFKEWIDGFMGEKRKEQISQIPLPKKLSDFRVEQYFTTLVDKFYQQNPDAKQDNEQQPAQAQAQTKQWKKPSGKHKRGLKKVDRTTNRPVESKVVGKRVMSKFLKEADARIQHAEDVIFWEGSKGAVRVVKALHSMSDKAHQDVTLKWDGSPAIVFGRDEAGQFIFTDKSGFLKKGGVGRTASPKALKDELLGRSGGKFKDDPNRIAFADNMARLFQIYEKAVSKNHRGYFKGDLLYADTPDVVKNHYTFTPNIVTYSVGTETDLGKRIGESISGVVIHREVDEEGNETPLQSTDVFEGNDVFVVPTITTVSPVEPDTKMLDAAEAIVKKHGKKIDIMIDEPTLREKQLTDLPRIFYTYMNSKVDTGLENLGADFGQWLEGSKLSGKKKANVAEYINEHKAQFDAMWQVVTMIKKAKNNIIEQFDSQGIDVKQSIGKQAGGEGYVLAHPEGDIKLVPRSTFSAANRAVVR